MNVFCFLMFVLNLAATMGEMLRSQAKDDATVLGLEIYGVSMRDLEAFVSDLEI